MDEIDLSHIIENRVIVKALHQRIKELLQIDLLCPAKLENIEFNNDKANLILEDKTELSANLTVAAAGTHYSSTGGTKM